MAERIDITVFGAGAFGLACAWAAARRGARVRVIDPGGPGAGASGGVVGALAPHAPEGWDALKEFQFRSLVLADGWWAEVAAAGGIDPGYARTGRLQAIGLPKGKGAAGPQVPESGRGAALPVRPGGADGNGGHSTRSAGDPPGMGGSLPARPGENAPGTDSDLRSRPAMARPGRGGSPAPSPLDRALQRGAGAAEHWGPDWSWEVIPAAEGGPLAPASPSGWLVRDTLSARIAPARACAALVAALVARGGEILREGAAAGRVIRATGAAGLVADGLGGAVKGQAALLRVAVLEAAGLPQISGPGLHVVPHADGTLALGSTSEPEVADTSTDGRLDDLIARAALAVPALAGAEVLRRWAGLRPRALRSGPLLGPHPGRPGEYIANGGYKIGLGLAPLAGEVMADLVLEGRQTFCDGFLP